MPEGEVRQIQIKGGAAEDYHRLKTGKRRAPSSVSASTRKAKQGIQEGGDAPPGQQIPLAPANIRRIGNFTAAMKGGSAAAAAPNPPAAPVPPNLPLTPNAAELAGRTTAGHAPPPVPVSTPATQASQGSQSGGKLVLAPPKKKTRSKVLLAPPGARKNPGSATAQAGAPGPSKRRHVSTRKIRVQLSGLKKRLTRAKSIHKDSQEKSISDIRKTLEEAKLIKPATEGKKVPDSMLRDIYKDYLLLRNKAL
jgi:hypothetical protein